MIEAEALPPGGGHARVTASEDFVWRAILPAGGLSGRRSALAILHRAGRRARSTSTKITVADRKESTGPRPLGGAAWGENFTAEWNRPLCGCGDSSASRLRRARRRRASPCHSLPWR